MRRYIGLDVLAKIRPQPTVDADTEQTEEVTLPAITA